MGERERDGCQNEVDGDVSGCEKKKMEWSRRMLRGYTVKNFGGLLQLKMAHFFLR